MLENTRVRFITFDTDHEVKGTVGLISGSDFPLTLRDGVTIIDVEGSALSSLPAEGGQRHLV